MHRELTRSAAAEQRLVAERADHPFDVFDGGRAAVMDGGAQADGERAGQTAATALGAGATDGLGYHFRHLRGCPVEVKSKGIIPARLPPMALGAECTTISAIVTEKFGIRCTGLCDIS